MKPLRSWRFKGDYGDVIVEESAQPGRMAIVIEREGDLRREWLDKGSFQELSNLAYQVDYAEGEETRA